MLVDPHGGRLVDRQLPAREVERRDDELKDLPQLRPEPEQVFDAARLGEGAYSPLHGFMGRATLESVLADGRLETRLPWPIPIFLTPPGAENARTLAGLEQGDAAALLDGAGRFFALLHVEEKFPLDRSKVAEGTYGTTDPSHPNVAALAVTGRIAIAGHVDLLRSPTSPAVAGELTPREARSLFASKGWSRVAAYQTRNVPHTAHEHLQRAALERDDVDGLFIHPIVGPLKAGDYRPEIVLEAYQTLVREYYAPDRVVLAPLTMSMRYAGPKAALFFAIVRKNFGCSHYIVGRDQAGVGTYYEPYACHRIFDDFPIGVQAIRYRELFYCPRCAGMVTDKTCGHPVASRVGTSQTKVRRAIAEGAPLPLDILRPEIAALLAKPGAVLNAASDPPRPPTPGTPVGPDLLPPMPRRQ